eukprot:TRINITY_DN14583_c0_g1_i1.p1 TRINITY_DN14583_c0_g1~~TRINITY_DN14583_c0_g1_i1.p1  ORF type:complete len:226 (-),score=34.10 TRINITY_DN14583_c0_g1_i1:103-780(-)
MFQQLNAHYLLCNIHLVGGEHCDDFATNVVWPYPLSDLNELDEPTSLSLARISRHKDTLIRNIFRHAKLFQSSLPLKCCCCGDLMVDLKPDVNAQYWWVTWREKENLVSMTVVLTCTNSLCAFRSKMYVSAKEIPEFSSFNCHTCGRSDQPLRKCTTCKSVQYCSQNCQKLDWLKHKTICTQRSAQSPSNNDVQEEPRSLWERVGSENFYFFCFLLLCYYTFFLK